ncbi:MAG: glycosyltransferase family 4 protein [Dysgonamonadaceae bacterium]|jgi:glycosyltransferase involved in cell wall biosynthesis|nr:glycosyltransferase family 4 protein [Dysgonamonadaceae bacterium]
MKITHVFWSFRYGGTETMLVDIVNRQCVENSVSLIIIKDMIDQELLDTIDNKVDVFPLGRKGDPKLHFFSIFFQINSIVGSIKPDVIFCHENTLFPFFIRWKQKTCLTLHTLHNVGLPVLFLKQYKKVFAVSKAVREDVWRRAKINAQVIYNGIEIAEYKSRNPCSLGVGEALKIVQISRLYPQQKGQHIAIEAVHLLKQQHPEINVRLYFIGSGDALSELQVMAERRHLQNEIVFMGQRGRSWIKNHLQDYHLLIQPSLVEGFGLTVIEGFACGLPVIVSNLDGPLEIVEYLNAGLLVEPNNSQDLSEKIVEVYQSYNNLSKTNYLIHDKSQLKIFDVRTTAQAYLDNCF